MPPRPHLAFRGRFDFHTSLWVAGLAKGEGSGAGPEPGAKPDASAFGPRAPKSRLMFLAIVAGEVVVFLATFALVVRGTTNPRQTSWSLFAVFIALFGLSYLRRRSFPAEPAN